MGKLVLITGVTKGLGRALLETFSQFGWSVVGCARSQSLIDDLSIEYAGKHNFSALDITKFQAIEAWRDEVCSLMGLPDIIINNASLVNKRADLWNVPTEEFSDIISVNILGTFNVIKAFLPKIYKKESIIVNISSYWGKNGAAGVAPYCASKFAIEGLTQALAKEIPQNLIALTLDPGIMQTEMLKKCASDDIYSQAKNPQEVADQIYHRLTKVQVQDSGTTLCIN